MALNFPNTPTNGQTYYDAASGNRYIYDSANTIWKYAANSSLVGSANSQILFNNQGAIDGSDALVFEANTLYPQDIVVTQNVTADYYFGNGAFLTGITTVVDLTPANNYANSLSTIDRAIANAGANSANAYAVTVGAAGNTYAMVYANGVANSANAGKVTSVTGTAGQIFSSGGTTPTLNLINTSVTASTYGSASNIPVFTVDGQGRLTYAANVAVTIPSGMDYAYVNTTANTLNTVHYVYANTVANNANLYSGTLYTSSMVNGNTSANSANIYGMVYANTVANNANLYSGTLYTSAMINGNSSANSANIYAAATFYAKTGGTVSGDVVITGNLTVSGQTTYSNTGTLLVGDNIVTLNADIPGTAAPTENAGIEINRGSKNANAQLIWVEAANSWGFTSNSQNAITTYLASNTDVVNAGAGANNYAGVLYTSAMVNGNTSANSANIYAMVYANGVANNANTGKVTSVTGTAGQIFSSGGTTPALNLINTAVTSSTYGGTSNVAVFTVDGQGRLTFAANVAISTGGMDYAYVNTTANTLNTVHYIYANTIGNTSNVYGMVYANTIGNTVNTVHYIYANTVANNANLNAGVLYTSAMINGNASANAANAYTVTVGAASNNYVNTRGAVANVSTTGPTNNSSGTLWWNSNTGKLYVYYTDVDTSQWVEATPTVAPIVNTTQKLYVANNITLDAFIENSINITTSYTITTGYNAMSAGPITINSGVTVTVPVGSTWTIV